MEFLIKNDLIDALIFELFDLPLTSRMFLYELRQVVDTLLVNEQRQMVLFCVVLHLLQAAEI